MAQTETPSADQQALALIQSSGILNPNVTLGKIMEVTATLATSSGRGSDVVDGFHTPRALSSKSKIRRIRWLKQPDQEIPIGKQ